MGSPWAPSGLFGFIGAHSGPYPGGGLGPLGPFAVGSRQDLEALGAESESHLEASFLCLCGADSEPDWRPRFSLGG